jgi:hypothetical protein
MLTWHTILSLASCDRLVCGSDEVLLRGDMRGLLANIDIPCKLRIWRAGLGNLKNVLTTAQGYTAMSICSRRHVYVLA